ncbi:polyphosphate:nucleotide phosphotransferase, PPK2 family [Ralstonia sp. 25mfcol4.1]|uniref:polyphosphate kinase 2 family protein n=1 Tax=Burkholderiaceae TaxID=119060 RepID=UPI00088A7BB0|nr:polyphosphate kinase 2 family protein [Ralstonia sp. 25mfcol4.1]SDP73877.1 polyphosphate:nucleotide phosphotransferase, PPK2 family [Ralstonia sp. 25mfcol4.1]
MSLDDFGITSGKQFKLANFDAGSKPLSTGNKASDTAHLAELSGQLDAVQDIFYAEHKHKLLIVLQGMDTSGKDGTVRSVFRSFDPLGVRVASFKAPTPEELARDYLWRVHAQVPRKGEIVIFNRSHYEDVLITRVHGWIDDAECKRRYRQIREFEQMLVETGTTIVKCFLHISKGEQKQRLEERIADPQKHWKFDMQDLAERKFWREYQQAYEDAIAATAAPHAPWYIVPADSKSHRNLMVAEILRATFDKLRPDYPPPKPELAKVVVE